MTDSSSLRHDAIVVGGGFAGIYMLYRLQQLGLTARLLEAGNGIGGTWYWNSYPGARVDTLSMSYSYSFSEDLQQEWEWTECYAAQPEILSYLEHVAERFDLYRDIQLDTRVVRAAFDEDEGTWEITTEGGEAFRATYCIFATGCLSVPRIPRIEGLESFRGTYCHTGRWPSDGVEFANERVGIIGTGSSGVQIAPLIAEVARHLHIFQRTANFSIPARNAPLDLETAREIKSRYGEFRAQARVSRGGDNWPPGDKAAADVSPEQATLAFEERWQLGGVSFLSTFVDLLESEEANALAAEFVRKKIRETVTDPAVAEALVPDDHPFGTKRLCLDTAYYETFNRENVTLVNVRQTPIQAISPKGIMTSEGEIPLDVIVFATGFDAMTGALLGIEIRGPLGELTAKWAEGPRSYLGVTVAGFPNLFMITGPGSPSVLSNMVTSIEQHVEWIADCIGFMRSAGFSTIEATPAAEDDWVAHVNEVAAATLYPRANSWYTGANIPGKPRVFMPYVGGVGRYRKLCEEIAASGYSGFALSA